MTIKSNLTHLKMLVLVVIGFAFSGVSADEAKSVFEERPDIKKIIGRDPRDIIDTRRAVREIDVATHRPLVEVPDAKSDVSEVYLTANEEIPVVYLVAGNPTTIEFTDITGAPWPILEHRSFSGYLNSKLAGTQAKNSLWAIARESVGEAVLSVYLKDLDTVVSVRCVSTGENYHRNKTVKIMKLGVNAKITRISVQEAEEAGSKVDEDLLSASLGIRPFEAIQLESSSSSVIAWEKGSVIFIYTSLDQMTPIPTGVKTGSSSGWTAFRIPLTSRLTLTNEAGNVVKVNLTRKEKSISDLGKVN